MIFLAVNFHYISYKQFAYPSIYPITPDNFEKQLDELGKDFTFVSLADVDNSLQNGNNLPELSCMITFDDGLTEQFEFGWSILKRKGIPAAFFVNTNPILERKVSLVHKIHLLRSIVEPQEFLNRIKDICDRFSIFFDYENIDEVNLNNQYKYDTLEVKKIKFALNFVLNQDDRERIIESLFAEYFKDEGKMAKQLYMNPAQWKELSDVGCLGTHSADHVPLGQLPYDEILANLHKSIIDMEFHTGKKPIAVSYPYGGDTAVSVDVEKAAQSVGLRFGLTMERAINRNISKAPLLLARIASNDAPGGEKPLFMIQKSNLNMLQILGNIGESRKKWIKD